jgi:5'-3' exonuclease
MAEITEEMKSFLETNKNQNTTCHNLWDTAMAVLKGKFIDMSAYIKNTEISQIHNLMLYLKCLEKRRASKIQNKQKERNNKRDEINEIEAKKTMQKSMKQKDGSLKRKNKIDKPLANLTKMRREKTQISKIRNEKWGITANNTEIQGIFRDCFHKIYFN